MSEEAIVVQLCKVLALHSITMSPRALSDICGELSLSGIIRGLRRAGLDARLIRYRPEDVAFLPPSSLVWLDDGPPAVVVAVEPSAVKVELVSGEVVRLGGSKRASLRGRAIAVRPKSKTDRSLVGRITNALKGETGGVRAIALVVVMAIVALAFGLATPMLSRVALNDAIPERAGSKLAAVAVGTFFLYVHSSWAGWIRRRAIMYIETKLGERGAEEVVRHLLGLPFAKLDKMEVGQILELVRLGQVSSQSMVSIATSLLDGVTALGYLGFVFWLDAKSGVATVIGAVLLLGVGWFAGKRAFSLRQATLDASRRQQQALYETIAGIETIKTEAAEERMMVRYLNRLVTLQGLAVKEQQEASIHGIVSMLIDRLVYGAILFFVALRVLDGEARFGDLMSGVQASASFFASAQALSRMPMILYALRAQVERIDAGFGDASEQLDTIQATSASPEGHDALVLRNVWFRYDPTAPWILKGLDVVVPRGATVVLEWPSGAGKSTLLRLLSGLLSPERGDVLVFGTEAARARHLVAYLPQHAALMPMSIMENLRMLSGGAPIERIAMAAQATGLAALVKTWPMGFETVVSAGGSNVSSGQRQLVLFTAAVASPAPILLLDEAFAHMDGIMRTTLANLDLLRGRTVVAVVHDASSRERDGATALVLTKGEGAKLLPSVSRPV